MTGKKRLCHMFHVMIFFLAMGQKEKWSNEQLKPLKPWAKMNKNGPLLAHAFECLDSSWWNCSWRIRRPCWRCHWGWVWRFQKPILFPASSLCLIFIDKDISSELLLQHRICLLSCSHYNGHWLNFRNCKPQINSSRSYFGHTVFIRIENKTLPPSLG